MAFRGRFSTERMLQYFIDEMAVAFKRDLLDLRLEL